MAAALAFGGNLGVAHLGTQGGGGSWDAQRDVLGAKLGGMVTMTALLIAG